MCNKEWVKVPELINILELLSWIFSRFICCNHLTSCGIQGVCERKCNRGPYCLSPWTALTLRQTWNLQGNSYSEVRNRSGMIRAQIILWWNCVIYSCAEGIFWPALTASTTDNDPLDFPEHFSTTQEGANIWYSAWFYIREIDSSDRLRDFKIWKKCCPFLTNPTCLVAALHLGLFLVPLHLWSLLLFEFEGPTAKSDICSWYLGHCVTVSSSSASSV